MIAALALYASERAGRRSERLADAPLPAPDVAAAPAVGAQQQPAAAEAPAATGEPSASADPTYRTATAAPQRSERRYLVRRGDSLDSIAREHYGSGGRAQAIYEANRDQIRDPNNLRPGQTLVLP